MPNTHIGFVGVGAMSQAILAGLLAEGTQVREHISVVGRSAARQQLVCDRFKVRNENSITRLAEVSDVLVLCVKPKDLPVVTKTLEGVELSGKLVVSTLAGTRIDALTQAFPQADVIRAIPNIAAETGTGVTLWCAAESTSASALRQAEAFWSSIGTSLQVADEALIDFGTPISGAAPAFLSLFVEALVDAAVYLGIPWETASPLVLQSLKGSCDLVNNEDFQTHRVRQRVTSPGGLTATAMAQLEAAGLRQAIMNAVLAGHNKTMELGNSR
ncbi:MAG: pyrroline-5-carboxylate reductase [Pseudomonadota bacterium]